ncbi:MAG: AMP-binding protein [Polyangiales bacterium]
MTHRAVLELAWRWSALVRQRGVRPGDRVIVLLPTGPDFVGALLGVMLAGAIAVPLAGPMTFGSAERYVRNLASIVEDCGATCIASDRRMLDAVASDARLRAALTTSITAIDLDISSAIHARGATSIDGQRTAMLQYTSGTTGRPKGVELTHRALVSNAFAIAHALSLSERDVGVSWLPLFHDMGLIGALLTSLCHPYALHVLPPEAFVMRPARWLELLTDKRATLSAAPNFAYELCVQKAADREGLDLSSLRCALNGAEPVLPTTLRRFDERFAQHRWTPRAMTPVYGLAENTLATAFSAVHEAPSVRRFDDREAVSCGGPVAATRIAIADERGRTLREGHIGRVRVASPSLMKGYFRNERATERALDGEWLDTGDLGVIDAGALYIVGRARDVIIKGGRNIHPYDVERVASDVTGVRPGSVAAFARSNVETGTDDLVIVIETTERDDGERARIAREVRGEVLSALGVKADDVRCWSAGSIPRTTSGKIQRHACAQRLAERGASES